MVAVIASTSLRPTLPAPASGGRKWIVKAAVVVAGAGKKRKLRYCNSRLTLRCGASYEPVVRRKRLGAPASFANEAARNLELLWLLLRLVADHKTIADFRKDNGPALRKVCAHFAELCREMGLLAAASVAIDDSELARLTAVGWRSQMDGQ